MYPSFGAPSCQAMTLISTPAGTRGMENLPKCSALSLGPSPLVSAAYGCSNAQILAFIQRWMSQDMFSGLVCGLRGSTSSLPGGNVGLKPGFLVGSPTTLVLCGTLALLWILK